MSEADLSRRVEDLTALVVNQARTIRLLSRGELDAGADERFDALLRLSSLGSSGARALRERTPRQLAWAIIAHHYSADCLHGHCEACPGRCPYCDAPCECTRCGHQP